MTDELIHLFPSVKRAREFYLYNDKGERFLDLYLDKGRAICGHRPGGLSLVLKNTISRGLYASYPSIYSDRLLKLLRKEFPRFHRQGLYRSLGDFKASYPGELNLCDPALDDNPGPHCLWRPYLEPGADCSLLVLSFPFPGSEYIAVLSALDEPLPESDIIPPYILSGLIRSYYDLKKRLDGGELQNWSVLDSTGHWKRRGPYLSPLCGEGEYEKLFRMYLACGIIISPYYNIPSICAVDIKEGSLKKIGKGELL